MQRIAKWTLLCVLGVALGFGATVLIANSERVAQTLVALLPAPAAPAPALEVSVPEAAPADLAEQPAAEAPVITGAASAAQPAAEEAQLAPGGALSAVGVISVVRDRRVVLRAGGQVTEIAVEVGDRVAAGDLLVALDTTYLDWAVEQAELAFQAARIDFEEAGKLVNESDIAVAQANLLLAQETLAEVAAGPTPEELAAAESSAAAAWARLEELRERPTPAQINQALANLKRAELAVQAAQREYDKIAWLPEAAASSAADALQRATIDLEAAKAAFDEANKPATRSEIQTAQAAAQTAQARLNELRLKPTPAELAAAEARVAAAEAALAKLQQGPEMAAVRKAELAVRQAMIRLEEARLAQSGAQVVAPIAGTVLALNVDLGQQVTAGTVAAVLADTSDIKLTVNVEQRDIAQVRVGAPVEIAIYALPEAPFYGVVEQIAPLASAGTGFVTFPVVIRFTDGDLSRVLPGMTAAATFLPTTSQATPAPTATPAPAEEPAQESSAEEPGTDTEAAEETTGEATEEAAEDAESEEGGN